MRDAINHIVFGWYPYLCLTVFLLGSLLRFDREQYTWKTGSSQLLRRRQLMWGSNLFHVGILVIFFGHFVGLLTPIWVFDAVGICHGFKQLMAIVVGGIAGIVLPDRHRAADAPAPVRSRASAPPRPSATSRSCCSCSPSFCSGSPPSRSPWATSTATRW